MSRTPCGEAARAGAAQTGRPTGVAAPCAGGAAAGAVVDMPNRKSVLIPEPLPAGEPPQGETQGTSRYEAGPVPSPAP